MAKAIFLLAAAFVSEDFMVFGNGAGSHNQRRQLPAQEAEAAAPKRGRRRGDPPTGCATAARRAPAPAHVCSYVPHVHIPARARTRQHTRAHASSCAWPPCASRAARRRLLPRVVAGATPKGSSGDAQSPRAAVSTDPAVPGMGSGGCSRGRAISPRSAPGWGRGWRGLRPGAAGQEGDEAPARCERAGALRPPRDRSSPKPLCVRGAGSH